MRSFRWRVRAISWAALVACAGIACRTTDRKDDGHAAASAAPPPPSGAPRNVPEAALALPREFAIEFSERPGKTAGTFELVVAVPSLPDAVVGTVSAREHCGIVSANTPLVNGDGSLRFRRGVSWTCREFDVAVWHYGEVLRVGANTYPLAGNAQITFPAQVKEAAREDCARRPSVSTDVRFERRASGNGPDAPWAFGIRIRDEFIEVGNTPRTSMKCETRAHTPGTSIALVCEQGSGGFNLWLRAQEGGLLIEWRRRVHTLSGSEKERQFGVDLGCGAKPRFHSFKLRDADFKQLELPCSERCALEKRDCLPFCYAHSFTIPAPGDFCQTDCQATQEKCAKACGRP